MKYIKNDQTFLERKPLEIAAKLNQLKAYKHKGFGNAWILKETRIDLKKLSSKKKKSNILIIGGTGFIGKKLIKKLPKNKFNIFSLSKTIKRKIKRFKNINYIFCDISKKNELYNSLNKYEFEIIVNLGGHVNHSEWKKTYDSHFIGSQNLANYFLKKN